MMKKKTDLWVPSTKKVTVFFRARSELVAFVATREFSLVF